MSQDIENTIKYIIYKNCACGSVERIEVTASRYEKLVDSDAIEVGVEGDMDVGYMFTKSCRVCLQED